MVRWRILPKLPADGYEAEVESSWYNYTGQPEEDSPPPAHAILTVPGKVIVLKTADGNYAKLEVLSYYEGNPDTTTDEFYDLMTRSNSGYYTFRYVVQTNGSREF
ncbi:HmuY family protein [Catalinimonas niigatensis]|uniref:HmuY family protein n=1 Tax=Catalinimonas niigatensis TaxID=1397264 RepID=UPI002666A66E|nr:HmuY family protein [Catalinimonas niigatensis]WPP50088.1 HmuY family protein [Catalinimonas niigatensis]